MESDPETHRTTLRGPRPVRRWFWTILALVIIALVVLALRYLYADAAVGMLTVGMYS
jgi:hypothetical protein